MNHAKPARHIRRRRRIEEMRERDEHTRRELTPTVAAMVLLFGGYAMIQLFCHIAWWCF